MSKSTSRRNVALLTQDAFHVLLDCGHLVPFLKKADVGRLSACASWLVSTIHQVPVLRVEGCDCASLRKLYRYLRACRALGRRHVHARLAVDELPEVAQFLDRTLETLLLQPVAFNWNPYALVTEVTWLPEFLDLKHLELSLNGQSAAELVNLMRAGAGAFLPRLTSLALSTNEACGGLWGALTAWPRPSLLALCLNGFRLEVVPLHHLASLRYLWICRPLRVRGLHQFFGSLIEGLPGLKYLATCDCRGLAVRAELAACLGALGAAGLPRLRYWETHQSDVVDADLVLEFLRAREHGPLTIQSVETRQGSVRVHPGGHWVRAPRNARLPLHRHRLYRSLDDVLDEPIHTYIPTAAGPPTVLRGLGVV